MTDRLPFPPPGRVLDGGELVEVARAVAEAEEVWTDLLRHPDGPDRPSPSTRTRRR